MSRPFEFTGMKLPVLKKLSNFLCSFVRDPLVHWPFLQISRQMMGNPAGPKQNLYGGLQLAYYRFLGRRAGTRPVDPEIREAAVTLRRTGVLKIEHPILSASLVDEIQAKFDVVVGSSRQDQSDEYFIQLDRGDAVAKVPEVFRVFQNQRLCDLIEEFFNSAFHVDQVVYRRTHHVPASVAEQSETYSDYWHCDASPTSELALFINLIEIDESCGPTMVIDKPHTRKLVRRYYRQRREVETVTALASAIRDLDCAQAFTGPPGSMLLTQSTKCLHRASIPHKGKHRDWLSFRLAPKRNVIIADRIVRNPILRYTHGKDV